METLDNSNAQKMLPYNIWLQLVLRAGNGKVIPILERFGSALGVYNADTEVRLKSGLFSIKELERISKYTLSDALKIIEECEKDKITPIGFDNEKFPDKVRNISDPPLVLYYKGELPDTDNLPAICIVGPREISEFGEKAAYSLAYRLSRGGMIIISGGALGCDSAAHKGALKANGITLAVAPCGLAHDYLLVNRPLRDKILSNSGCLVSEYPPKASVQRNSFQVRNRILSAFSLGTVVIEASEHSGALITARHANEQGRDVFVIPGNPTLPQYKGSNKLLSDGAKPLLDANSVFDEYLPIFGEKINVEKAFEIGEEKNKNKTIQKKSAEGLSKEAKIVYNSLNKQKFTADDLLGIGISDNDILVLLTELEMLDYIEALPGGFYTLK